MKILMISDTYGVLDGIRTYTKILEEELQKKGHEVFFIWFSKEKSIETKRLKVLPYGFRNKFQWFFSENLID